MIASVDVPDSRASTRVAVVGSPWVGGTSRSVADGFQDAGFETRIIPLLDWLPERWVYSHYLPGTGLLARLSNAASMPALEVMLLDQLRRYRPDLVVLIKCDFLHHALYRATREWLKAKVVAFHPDDPFDAATFFRRGPSHRRALLQMRVVDHYFLWSPRLVEQAERAGAKSVHYLPFAYDARVFPPSEPSAEDVRAYHDQVTFLGNWDREREAWLGALTEFKLGIYGSAYWKTRCQNAKVTAAWRPRTLRQEEKSRLLRASAINLNFLRIQNRDACNQRTFEIPGCGGFMLHERSRALPDLFKPGVACDDFASPEELRDKIRFYLDNPDIRARIARAGHEKVQQLTYRRWAERVVETVAGRPASESPASE